MSDNPGKIGIIGGSGLYNIDGGNLVAEHVVETPYGNPSDAIIEMEIDGNHCFFLARHGRGHKFLPSEINYRANIYAMKKLGIKYLISISAVGSLKEELEPTRFVLIDQFIDWTKGKRERSFFGNGIAAHVSVANPVETKLQKIIQSSCEKIGLKHSVGGSYICIEGPQFSSRAESEIYRGFGASVIGMTNVPESYLAKEAGLAYATVAMVTDYDCWKEEHCTLDEIMKVMKENNKNAHQLVLDLIPNLSEQKFEFQNENLEAVLTPKENLSTEQIEILSTLQA